MKKYFPGLLLSVAMLVACQVTHPGADGGNTRTDSARPAPVSSLVQAAATSNGSEVLLQGFHWKANETKPWWTVIRDKAPAIAGAGFTMVWFPPSQDAGSAEGYLPRRLYLQDGPYGTRDQLKGAIDALHAKNVRVLGDIVVNHRVGFSGWADFVNPDWPSTYICKDDEWPGGPKSATNDTGQGNDAGRDLDHTNGNLRQSIKDWMNWLKSSEIGYDGWRYDMVKGYSPWYTTEYDQATAPYFSVGEALDNDRNAVNGWLDSAGGTVSAFDFPTRSQLLWALSNGQYSLLKDGAGKPGGLIGLKPARSVTFVENHDTEPVRGGAYLPIFPGENIMPAYAYILTHPGTPCVFWSHYFDWTQQMQDDIKALIQLRRDQGITSTATVNIVAADSSKYAAYLGTNAQVAVKIGPGDWSPSGSGWAVFRSGKNWCVWTAGNANAGWSSLYLRGTFNVWGATPMTKSGSVWSANAVTFGPTASERFKFDVKGDWSQNYGGTGLSGAAIASGPDIAVSANTSYDITFDEAAKTYAVSRRTGNTLRVHYHEFETANTYTIHSWNGLTADTDMTYEGQFNGKYWWVVTINNPPASFQFAFKNSNAHWDGVNRLYSGQGAEIFVENSDSRIYTVRP